MSDTAASSNQDFFDDDITSKDYGFIFDEEGNLKSVFMPEDFSDIPEGVLKIFQMCGIKDPRLSQVYTVH